MIITLYNDGTIAKDEFKLYLFKFLTYKVKYYDK